VGTAIGLLEEFDEQVHRDRRQLPPVEEMCHFCQAVGLKMKQNTIKPSTKLR
jgi:hypothetical protein